MSRGLHLLFWQMWGFSLGPTVLRHPPHLHLHLHPRPQPVEHRHQPIRCEASQFGIANTRQVRRRYSRPRRRRPHRQPVPFQHLDDLGSQYGLELRGIRIRTPQVPERVPASPYDFHFFAPHRNISFNRFSRSRINSISRCGVLIPWVDFFWNACTTQRSSPICTAYTTRYALPRNGSATSSTPAPIPVIGFAMSALPPSAAIVSALRQMVCAPSGNFSNSFSAALIHEMGRVCRVMAVLTM